MLLNQKNSYSGFRVGADANKYAHYISSGFNAKAGNGFGRSQGIYFKQKIDFKKLIERQKWTF